MGKKKPFIDKKNSSTYHLLYRSQRDVAGADDDESGVQNSGVILWPSPDNNKVTDNKVLMGASSKTAAISDEQKQHQDNSTNDNNSNEASSTIGGWKEQLSKAGLVDDYDYDQHLKPITGSGKFLDVSKSKYANALYDSRSKQVVEDEYKQHQTDGGELMLVQEVDRQLESIALNADCMDDDIAEALFGDFEECEFEELNDDFVFDAAKEPEHEDDTNEPFDFAAHVRTLMERARMESEETRQLATVHEHGVNDQAFFSNVKPLHNDDDSDYFDDDLLHQTTTAPGAAPKLTSAEEKALCDKFHETLAEYDSDELGDIYEEEIAGPRPLEGDKIIEAALDDFRQEKKDDIFMQGTRHYMEENGQSGGGSGFAALVGTHMVPIKKLNEEEGKQNERNAKDIQPMEEILAEATVTLSEPKKAPPAEEVFIDGKSYYSEKIRNPWDCESILSTYSNLDNNPVTIGAGGSGRRRRKQKKKGGNKEEESILEQEQYQQILLSDKTGLPLGVLGGNGNGYDTVGGGGEDTYISVNKGESRNKMETTEEKKSRKLQVKKERQMARMQKKMMKEAFSNEFAKRTNEVMADDVGGKSVFRF